MTTPLEGGLEALDDWFCLSVASLSIAREEEGFVHVSKIAPISSVITGGPPQKTFLPVTPTGTKMSAKTKPRAWMWFNMSGAIFDGQELVMEAETMRNPATEKPNGCGGQAIDGPISKPQRTDN